MSRLVLSYVAEVASNSQSSSLPHAEITETPPGVAFKKNVYFFPMYMRVLPACICKCATCMCPQKPRGQQIPGTTDNFEPPRGCREQKPGPLPAAASVFNH